MPSEATQILREISSGIRSATPRLMELLYNDFRRLARGYLSPPMNSTLRPTELVHEVFIKLVDHDDVDWRGRSHFFAVGAKAMRQILVDHARRKGAEKRGSGRAQIRLDEKLVISPRRDMDVLDLEEALQKLAGINEQRAEMVELHFYGGLTSDEVAEVMGVSRRTVQRQWTATRLWLHRELSEEAG